MLFHCNLFGSRSSLFVLSFNRVGPKGYPGLPGKRGADGDKGFKGERVSILI